MARIDNGNLPDKSKEIIMKTSVLRTLGALLVAVLLAACSGMQSEPPQKSLYERLGGKPAIQAVVDDFIGNVAGDSRINSFFAHTDIPRLNTMLVNQICEATGGPCKYEGRSMKAAHAGMGVGDAQFNALVEDLVKSLDKFNVPAKEKNELLTALASMKGDIVTK
jgi:hemoglobin